MFTGIVEEVGSVKAIERQGDALRLSIASTDVVADAFVGASIAVNGVCLTVTEFSEEHFVADVMQVTLNYTTIGSLAEGDPVNLERAVAAGGRFGGHIMQGHVDGYAKLIARAPSEHWEVFRFQLSDSALARYVVKKGSIALNGTSLTVAEMAEPATQGPEAQWWFEVSLIPTTLADTMLGSLQVGDRVNVECDVLAKYVERMTATAGTDASAEAPGTTAAAPYTPQTQQSQ